MARQGLSPEPPGPERMGGSKEERQMPDQEETITSAAVRQPS